MIIITGTSSGIGKAIANFYLAKGEKVVGISRTTSIAHDNYTHIRCDLSIPEEITALDLSEVINTAQTSAITLINNAGSIGEIKRSWDLATDHFLNVATLNIVAVQSLCAQVLQLAGHDRVKSIVSISSGAGRRAIASWSAYCASKAAVDLFSETLKAELDEIGADTKVYSVAPGVVDTAMQTEIRSSTSENFSSHQNFVDLKANDALRDPNEVALLLHELLQQKQQEIICRL